MEGLHADIVQLLSKEYNFTVKSFQEPNGDWGAFPKTGKWTDKNATFSGILGGLINDKYDISITDWLQTKERRLWIDYTMPIFKSDFLALMNADGQPLDYSLFVRPFNRQSWQGSLVMFLVIIVIKTVMWKMKNKSVTSKNIVILSWWIFYVLTEAFYEGALTMFFATEHPTPFKNIREGLNLHPTYKMIIIPDSEIWIQSFVAAKDPAFMKYWNVLQSDEGSQELVGKSVKDSLEKLFISGNFLTISSLILVQFLGKNGRSIEGLNLKLISKEFPTYSSMIFSKNSPWKRVFDKGLVRLRENGFIDINLKRFDKALEFSDTSSSTLVIAIEHAAVVFIAYGVVILISLFMLSIEIYFLPTREKIMKRINSFNWNIFG